MKKLDKEYIERLLEPKASITSSDLEDRINYVLKQIYLTFGKRLSNWYVDDAEEGCIGNILLTIRGYDFCYDYIANLHLEPQLEKDTCIVDRHGQEIDLKWGGFPVRWLSEDFEDELKAGNVLWKEMKENQKMKRLQKKNRKAELIASAKSKLTFEEQKAVGIK